MMLNDYKCPRHGNFEGSHAICPAMGCDSEGVEKIFLKAPAMKSDQTRRFDDGIRRSAEMYGQSDFRTAREGESAKANNRANELLWGSNAERVLGKSAGAAVGGVEGQATPGSSKPEGWAPAVIDNGPAMMRARTERIGVKKQDDQWHGQLQSTLAESREKLKTTKN